MLRDRFIFRKTLRTVSATIQSKLYESSWFAYLLLAFNVLGLGIWPVMLDLSSGPSSLLGYMILVFAIGTCASVAATLITGDLFRIRELLVNGKTVAYLSAAGLLNYGIASLLMTYGTVMLSPDVSILVNRSWVLLMVPFIPLILREKVKGAQVLSLVVGFFALYLALTGGTVVHLDYGELPYMLIVLCGALSTAVSSLMIKTASVKLSVQLFLFNFVSLLFFLIAAIPLKLLGVDLSLRLSFALLASSAFVGLVTYFFGAYAYFYALNKLRITVVGSSLLSVPFITFAFSYVVLGEKLKVYFVVTALILVAAIAVQSLYSRGMAEIRIRGLKCVRAFDVRSTLVDRGYDSSYPHVSGKSSSLVLISREAINDVGERCVVFDLQHAPEWIDKDVLKRIADGLMLKEGERAVFCIGDLRCIEERLKKAIRCG